jgi:hypothetical protein
VSNAPLAAEVQRRWDYLCSVNSFHLSRIAQIEALPGYFGSRAAGIRLGHMDTSTSSEFQDEGDVRVNGGEVDDDVVHDDPDGEQQTLMEDFFDHLHDGPAGMDEE